MPGANSSADPDPSSPSLTAMLPDVYHKLKGQGQVEEIDGRKKMYFTPGKLSNRDKLTIALTLSFHRAKIVALQGSQP